MGIRFSLNQYSGFVRCIVDADCHNRCAHRSRNDRLVLGVCVDLYISARLSISERHSGRPLRWWLRRTAAFLTDAESEIFL